MFKVDSHSPTSVAKSLRAAVLFFLKTDGSGGAVAPSIFSRWYSIFVIYVLVVICLGGRFVALISPQYISSLHRGIFSPK